MDAKQLDVKFYLQDVSFEMSEIVPVFHSWIQQRKLSDVLIDVADYSHVPEGPGVVLVAHEGHYYLDQTKGRLGLLYSRRRELEDGFDQRLKQAFVHALSACKLLEQEQALAGKLRFGTDEAMLRINDRLLAPNQPGTFERVEPALRKLTETLYAGHPVQLQPRPPSKEMFTVDIKTSQAPDLGTLLARLA